MAEVLGMTAKTDRPLWRGRTNVSYVVQQQVEFAEKLRTGGNRGRQFIVSQGSFQAGGGDLNSAGTHDRDGCIDIQWTGDPDDIRALRRAGLWAWHRTPAQGPWPEHIHCVSLFVSRAQMSSAAQKQLDDAKARPPMNGLAGHVTPDDGPLLKVEFTWPMKPPTQNITRALNASDRTTRREALTAVSKHGSASAKRAAVKYLAAIKAVEAAEKQIESARKALEKAEVK